LGCRLRFKLGLQIGWLVMFRRKCVEHLLGCSEFRGQLLGGAGLDDCQRRKSIGNRLLRCPGKIPNPITGSVTL
jgi:hypothetical protein